MSKFRFIYFILSTIIIFILVFFTILNPTNAHIYIFIEVLIFAFNYQLKKKEREKILKITYIYINECDPNRYLFEIEKINRSRIKSKEAKTLDKILKSLVYLDAGRVEECYNLLMSLVDFEPNFNGIFKFWYYKAWINYYDEVNEIERMKYLIDRTKELLDKIHPKYRHQLEQNYLQTISRYYVKAGIFLDTAEANYREILKGKYPKITMVNSIYYLAIIAYKQQNYEVAKNRLLAVIKNGEKLFIKEKAKLLLEKIEKSNV